MLKWLKQSLDRCAIRAACASLDPSQPRPVQRLEAAPSLDRARLFDLAKINLPALDFANEVDFLFRSHVESPSSTNNVVRGKLLRCPSCPRGVVVLVHGWNAELQYRYEFPWLARKLARQGLHTAMMQLPFHGARRPRERGIPSNFINDDLALMLQLVQQSLSDLQALSLWLQREGLGPVAVWGFSLGAWLTGLFSAHSTIPAAAVLTTPICRMQEAIERLPFCAAIQEALKVSPVDLSPLDLARFRPILPPENILLVESDYDLFASVESVEDVWKAWARPEIWRVKQSHISILLSLGCLGKTARWLGAHSPQTENAIATPTRLATQF